MKQFRTMIITKNTIKKFGIITASAVTVSALCVAALKYEPSAVPAFSRDTGNIPEAILEEGLPQEDKEFDLSEFISKITGFDTDQPETIIENATAIKAEDGIEENGDETVVDEQPDNSEAEKPAEDRELPSHEEIITANGLDLNNATSYSVDLDALCKEPLPISLTLDEPEVLIVHTHTTECFVGDEMTGESERTTDEAHNMCAVGDVIANTLEDYGIKTIHDKTIHDYPSYKGAYTRELESIDKNMKEYPSIRVILDVHRDAYIYNDGSKLSVKTDIDGIPTAQVMLVMGTDSMGLYHPYWRDNLTLAAKIENAAEIMYPGLMRSVNLRRERFNMHVTRGSLLLEVGSNGNTLDEALRGGEFVARAIAAALLNG